MNTATNEAVVIESIPTAPKVKKSKSVNVSSESMTVQVYDGANVVYQFDLSQFPKGIGEMAKKIGDKVEFEFLGHKFLLPSYTGRNCNAQRCAVVYRQLVANFFPAEMDKVQSLPKDSKEAAVIESLKKSGFKFTALTKAQVQTAIETKIAKWNQLVQKDVLHVKKLNALDIFETKQLRLENKETKAEILTIMTGFEKKQLKNS